MTERIPVIALDGNHRVGKGTQLSLTAARLRSAGFTPHILRCDGSRPGTGACESDPKSDWWKNFKTYASNHEHPYDAWRQGARKLIGEAAHKMSSLDLDSRPVMLYDRSYLSRTQMALKEGLDLQDLRGALYGTFLDEYTEDAFVSHLQLTESDLMLYIALPVVCRLQRVIACPPNDVVSQ